MTERAPARLAPVAMYVSQETSLAVAGIPGRRWRELVRRSGMRCTRVGQLVLVHVAELQRYLAEHQSREQQAEQCSDGVAQLAARLGIKRAAGGQ